MDGHTSLHSEELWKHQTNHFQLVLSRLDLDADYSAFIVHAIPIEDRANRRARGLRPGEFLARIGFEHFAHCKVNMGRPCLWLNLVNGIRSNSTVHLEAKTTFDSHAERIDKIFNLYAELHSELTRAGVKQFDLFPELRQREAPVLTPPPNSLPFWAEAEMPACFAYALNSAKSSVQTYRRMLEVAGLLFETGDDLEQSVTTLFEELDFKVEPQEKGHTYDLKLIIDSDRALLVEVSGIDGMLKKNSEKFGQVAMALQGAEKEERVLLALNSYRNKPLNERKGLDVASAEAKDLFQSVKCLIVETKDLFQLWQQSLVDKAAARQCVLGMHSAPPGIFQLPAESGTA